MLTIPAPITVEATGAATPVSFAASATDLGESITPVCHPTPGSGFSVGTTTVTCLADDTHGLSASATFTVTVTDTTPPLLTAPSDITTEATGATTVVTFDTAATDHVDGPIVPICHPASGFGFPVGITPVTCIATDAHHNSASRSFGVTVTDNTPPALIAPSDMTAPATSPAGAIVTFAATASDAVDGPRPVTCGPPSGATFAIGATTVMCAASDLRGNSASRTFTVTVTESEAPGRMTGHAAIETGAVKHAVDFKVQEHISGIEAGTLRYRITAKKPGRDLEDEFESTVVTGVGFFNQPGGSPRRRPASGIDTVSFAGSGRWNGHTGYTFTAVAVDAGEPGRGRDSFTITVADGAGHVVATVNAVITDGNIQSSRAKR